MVRMAVTKPGRPILNRGLLIQYIQGFILREQIMSYEANDCMPCCKSKFNLLFFSVLGFQRGIVHPLIPVVGALFG